MGFSDIFGAVLTGVGCAGGGIVGGITVGPGCAAGALAGLGFDIWFAGASQLAVAENVLGLLSLGVTSANDIISGNTVVDFQNGNIAIGQDTLISTRNAIAGLIPESNLDALVSFSQLKYDFDRIEGNKQGGYYQITNNWNVNINQLQNAANSFLFSNWW